MSADPKYGEIYTEDEVVEVVQLAVKEVLRAVSEGNDEETINAVFNEADIREVARTEIERRFLPGEPLFILRGQDKRAMGAVRWYRDHQWPNATKDHIENIDVALAFFEQYRKVGAMKEPD
jgi:hypothetical protein